MTNKLRWAATTLALTLFLAACASTGPQVRRGYDVILTPNSPKQLVMSTVALYALTGHVTADLLRHDTIPLYRAKQVRKYRQKVWPFLASTLQILKHNGEITQQKRIKHVRHILRALRDKLESLKHEQ